MWSCLEETKRKQKTEKHKNGTNNLSRGTTSLEVCINQKTKTPQDVWCLIFSRPREGCPQDFEPGSRDSSHGAKRAESAAVKCLMRLLGQLVCGSVKLFRTIQGEVCVYIDMALCAGSARTRASQDTNQRWARCQHESLDVPSLRPCGVREGL